MSISHQIRPKATFFLGHTSGPNEGPNLGSQSSTCRNLPKPTDPKLHCLRPSRPTPGNIRKPASGSESFRTSRAAGTTEAADGARSSDQGERHGPTNPGGCGPGRRNQRQIRVGGPDQKYTPTKCASFQGARSARSLKSFVCLQQKHTEAELDGYENAHVCMRCGRYCISFVVESGLQGVPATRTHRFQLPRQARLGAAQRAPRACWWRGGPRGDPPLGATWRGAGEDTQGPL